MLSLRLRRDPKIQLSRLQKGECAAGILRDDGDSDIRKSLYEFPEIGEEDIAAHGCARPEPEMTDI